MTTLTRWKLACALFAGVAVYATLGARGTQGAGTPAALAAGPRGAAIPAYLRRPVRVSAEAAGLSRSDLIARALGARTLRDLRVLTDKLGLIGDDATVDALVPLVTDTRSGFPEEVLAVYGLIGTEHAIDGLIAATEDDRAGVRTAAITALGTSQGARAEAVLVGIASAAADPGRDAAIRALGRLGGERAITVLIEIAHGDFAAASGAIDALGAISSPDAAAALRELIDAPDVRVAALALGQIQELDAPLTKRLTEIVQGADPSLSGAALALLARAGAASLPVLREAALEGPAFTRSIAVAAIGEIEGPEATRILGEILETGDRAAASAAAEALAGNGGPEARELLIASALGDRAQITGALTQLQTMEGDDVDQALLSVIAQGASADRRAALPSLLRAENPKALALAAEFARTGSRNERYEVMRMLSDAGSAKAIDTLVEAYRAYRQSVTDPWPLTTCGSGPLEPLLRGVEGIENRGFLQPADLGQEFRRAGVFILPSRVEPWGQVIVEAAASGLPVICSQDCGAGVELVRDYHTGFIIPTDDVEAGRRALVKMHHAHADLPTMGREIRHAAAAYSAERWADNQLGLFARLLDRPD